MRSSESPHSNNIPWIFFLHDKGTIRSSKSRYSVCDRIGESASNLVSFETKVYISKA